MNDLQRARLMDAVLDREATEAEVRELERLLTAEPAARTEFDQLRHLFDELGRVPKAFPPEGLAAAVLANIPQNSAPQRRLDQLSSRSRVVGVAWMKARGTSPGKSAKDLPAYQPGIYLREWKMSEQSGGLSRKRNVLIGGGIAIVAALLTLSYTIDFPSGVQNTVGTIVPAQRYKATQPEINVGTQSTTQAVPAQAASAAGAATNNAVSNATDNVVNQAADKMVNQAADKMVNQAADKMVNQAADKMVNQAADKMVNQAADKMVNQAADKMVNQAADKMVNQAADKMVNQAADKMVNQAAGKMVNQAADKAINQAADKAINQAVDKSVNQAVFK
ncbi:MAG TPA: hypothetical protein VGL25_09560 [Casimicrobiaceae bacterium]